MIDLLEAEIQEHRDDTKKQTKNPNTAHYADGSVDVQSSERKRVRELFYDQLDQEEEIKQAKITVKEAAAQQKAIGQQILDGQGKLDAEARNLEKKLRKDAYEAEKKVHSAKQKLKLESIATITFQPPLPKNRRRNLLVKSRSLILYHNL